VIAFWAVAAVLGLVIFGVTAWQAVSVSQAGRDDARERIAAVRARVGSRPPMVDVDAAFTVVRRTQHPDTEPTALDTLGVLAYRATSRNLVRIDVPFWFCKLKGPALEFVLRDTDLDLEQLGVSIEDLERHGPGLILDETSPDGDSLLVWTE
jgi:hypothetical protein